MAEIRASVANGLVYVGIYENGMYIKATFPAWFLCQLLVHSTDFAKKNVLQTFFFCNYTILNVRTEKVYS